MNSALETAYPDSGNSTGLMLWRVNNSWQRTIRSALAPFGLTHVQFVLLAVLTAMDRREPVTQRDISAHARTDPMMTSQVLRALESKGLLERFEHPTDGRARALAPTLSGISLVNRANVAVEQADCAYFSALGDDVASFTRSLVTLDAEHTEV